MKVRRICPRNHSSVFVIQRRPFSVVDKLTKYYNVNFGVRSVLHEVQRIAVQLVAEVVAHPEEEEMGWTR